jgi:hypothetical protein
MNPIDPIIFIIYIVCVSYVIFKMIDNFNDEYTIRMDAAALQDELKKHDLQDTLAIGFGFAKHYEFDKLKQLNMTVSNKSKSQSVYIDWDACALTNFGGGQSRRVIRLLPVSSDDVSVEQVYSTVSPGTALQATITAEDVLNRKDPKSPVATFVDVAKPLVNPRGNQKFIKHVIDLEFYCDLAFRTIGVTSFSGGDRAVIRCKFILSKVPWTAALPWNPR